MIEEEVFDDGGCLQRWRLSSSLAVLLTVVETLEEDVSDNRGGCLRCKRMMPLSLEVVVYVDGGCLHRLRGMSPVVEDVLKCVTSLEKI